MNRADILAVGAHPDDVEIGMGGTLAKHVEKGAKVALCSLTKGELSSNGTVEERQQEAREAAEVLGVQRYQLEFSDRSLHTEGEDFTELVALIRAVKPKVVFAPMPDRHPDHGMCGKIVKEAVFNAKIKKYQAFHTESHKVDALHFYMINGIQEADFYVDVSAYIEKKIKALSCYKSQFERREGTIETPLTNGYVEGVRAREYVFGKQAGVGYAEAFIKDSPLLIDNLLGV
ncbi:bacillithiol biosynthesis deacetylase BshB1 [Thalassobacillus sp. C254]|uniref:bacillithiol biosynthesis deacetylase BshB1 n=1 Tax=Thalassobacillus sp. C254 TaxID=1225341 RepID=UPI0006D16AA6|nr:bacillithiol biosynthesis deacetylase BshB1 [Thalassobacillus sp. C254]